MAALFSATGRSNPSDSDYGSDFSVEEESIVLRLLDDLETIQKEVKAEPGHCIDPVLQADIDAAVAADLFVSSPANILECGDESALKIDAERDWLGQAKTPAARHGNASILDIEDGVRAIRSTPLDGIDYPDLSRALSNVEPVTSSAKTSQSEASQVASPKEDSRSPIERFRSFPKKPLTVTDLSSGAWCELQYWYTLTLVPGGRKTRTPAMRGGTKVHQKLEDQVHTTIQVNVSRKEEAFALRLWNIIQGLRTLRDTGLTRELEVWGVVDGQVINGVIDELSYTSPNVGFEEELSQSQSSQDGESNTAQKQPSVTNYFDPHHRRVYLTDIKTRGSNRLPSGAALRPSRVQLFLYHRLLSGMAAGLLDFSTIIARYGLHPESRFSDAFMAQIGSLHDEVFDEEEPGEASWSNQTSSTMHDRYPEPSPSARSELSPPPDLMRYRSIQQIIPLLQSELRDTFPRGADNLGGLVAIQYRHRDDGHVIGTQSFPSDAVALSNFLKLDLAWWLGKRNPDGVPIEEAYKCRMCEFAESCQWRQERNAEIVRKSKGQDFGVSQARA
ncbi:defects in morphology protein 1 [Xylariales sp. AK1849]|nr:defects in morphology protein 1 [Xylariales sp. AK1849]